MLLPKSCKRKIVKILILNKSHLFQPGARQAHPVRSDEGVLDGDRGAVRGGRHQVDRTSTCSIHGGLISLYWIIFIHKLLDI